MGQQPNIPLEMGDLPRPTDHPGSPRRWSPRRPGEVRGPGEVPGGGRFGTPGPDTGYALRLLEGREIPTAPGERRGDAVAAVAAVMGARASALGRAPVIGDAVAAEAILGYRPGAPPGATARRAGMVAGVAHHPERLRLLVAAVDDETLVAPPERVAERAAAGETLVEW